MAKEIYVPEEIIIEILSRLPVKSVIRFRSVSKSWKSITIDPKFIKKHLNHSTKHHELSLQRALLHRTFSSQDFVSCRASCLSDYNSIINESEKLHCPVLGRVAILGSCNGMLWIEVINQGSFLWNPTTREIKKLPERPPYLLNTLQGYVLTRRNDYGVPEIDYVLGYDSFNDDYKIVCIVNYDETRPETVLYSLKTDSWRVAQDSLPYGSGYLKIASSGKFVNGACHWVWLKSVPLERGDSSPCFVIVSYDLSEEKYGEVACPDELAMPAVCYKKLDLAVLRGMLCIYSNSVEAPFTLWAMEEYGVKKSWTQMFKFEYCRLMFLHPVPMFLFDNGELLLEARNRHRSLIIAKYKDVQILEVDGFNNMQIYLESLVSPSSIIRGNNGELL